MTNSAQTRAQKLDLYKRQYTSLYFQAARAKRSFRYPAEVLTKMTTIRNEIVQLESMTPRLEVNAIRNTP